MHHPLFLSLFVVFIAMSSCHEVEEDAQSIFGKIVKDLVMSCRFQNWDRLTEQMRLPANNRYVEDLLRKGFNSKIEKAEVESEGRIIGEALFVSEWPKRFQDFKAKIAMEKNPKSFNGWKITGFYIMD